MDAHTILNIAMSLLTLTLLEVILGIDNLVFIAIASSRLPPHQQPKARTFGLLLALITRLILLASVAWLAHLTSPVFSIQDYSFSVRDLLMLGGGLFLLYKGTVQIHEEIEPEPDHEGDRKYATINAVILQIGLLDIIFSFDSVFTAVGMTQTYWIMATAITIAIIAMIWASTPLTEFIHKRPTIKVLALSFILLVGVMLVADGFHYHIPRGYVYFSIFYAIFVEAINTLVRQRKLAHEKSHT